ncbi:hypothetical protein [Microbulbifer sp. ARAS458-1]|uniref:hypothetical protein n=1 Tax=Microbulbifer sp. ARAS458-1 TaxID=3140242 RepID=UPI003877ED0B
MKSLINSTAALFASRRKICRQFIVVAPARFFSDVLVSFIKSFLELFVFILPIKIVLILAAPQMPVMFDRFVPGISRAEWAGILTALIVVLHIVVLIQDWYLNQSADKYARKFSFLHKKGRFTGNDFLISAYNGIVSARGSTFLLLALSLVIGFVYLDFLAFLVVALGFVVVAAAMLASASSKFRDAFLDSPPTILGRASNLIFIACFCFLVYAFVLSERPPEFLQGVVSIILGRRLLGAVTQKASNLVWFSKKKAAVQKLFYRGHTELPGAGSSGAFIDKMSQGSLEEFTSEALSALGVQVGLDSTCDWVESPFPWMSLVQCRSGDTDLLLKVYESNKARAAKNELELYPDLETLGVIPKFIGVTEVDGYQVHAFELAAGWNFTRDRDTIISVHSRLQLFTFDSALVEEYCSVHPTLTDRINPVLLSRLSLLADSDEKIRLDSLVKQLPAISERIKALPLSLVVQDPVVKQLTLHDDGRDCLLGLGDWKLEPLGFHLWPSDSPEKIAENVISAHAGYEEGDIAEAALDIQFCSLLAVLERHCRGGRLREGIKVVNQILALLETQSVGSEELFTSA